MVTFVLGACGGSIDADSTVQTAPAGPVPTAGLWVDATPETIGETGDWTNKVDLADLDGDGRVDILFANGGNYREPGDPVLSRIFLNKEDGFHDASEQILGPEPGLTRVIKTADVNADGNIDIFLGSVYERPSRLLLGQGGAEFKDVSKTNLPEHALSLGDAEFGDVDFDGDLDLALADWGEGNPMKNDGATPILWLNDGAGKFTPAEGAIPPVMVKMSWDLELTDVDNDADLDLWISSKLSDGSFLLLNDGTGKFEDVTAERMPQFTNNYELEPMDLNGDGYVDTVTINDGGQIEGQRGMRKENVFLNDGQGGFLHATPSSLPDSANLGYDDNRIVYLDYDSDGDADVIIGSLSGPDRLLINDGKGVFTVATDILEGPETKGTLCLALADFNGDHKLDIAMAQGEVKGFVDEKIYLGAALPADAAPPVVKEIAKKDGKIYVRVHDNKGPSRPFDFKSVTLVASGQKRPMTWYGEHLWAAAAPEGDAYEICATDKAGNQTCAK